MSLINYYLLKNNKWICIEIKKTKLPILNAIKYNDMSNEKRMKCCYIIFYIFTTYINI